MTFIGGVDRTGCSSAAVEDFHDSDFEDVEVAELSDSDASHSRLLPSALVVRSCAPFQLSRGDLVAGPLIVFGVCLVVLYAGRPAWNDSRLVESGSQQLFVQGTLQANGSNGIVDDTSQAVAPVLLPRLQADVVVTTTCCAIDEEVWGNLCYKQCALLTNETHKLRTGPQSCWSDALEGDTKVGLKLELNPCSGFNVAGEFVDNGGCPHMRGMCSGDEEMEGGICYKKCSDLTGGKYRNRVAGNTCCKKTGGSCFLPWNIRSDVAFGTSGRNACRHDEEQFEMTCYKKCRLVAGRKFPHRKAPATCCSSYSALLCVMPYNTKTDVAFDVPGGSSCPEDEEFLDHMCYKRCSKLTNGQFPYRMAPATCCVTTGSECAVIANTQTSPEFAQSSGIDPASLKGLSSALHAVTMSLVM